MEFLKGGFMEKGEPYSGFIGYKDHTFQQPIVPRGVSYLNKFFFGDNVVSVANEQYNVCPEVRQFVVNYEAERFVDTGYKRSFVGKYREYGTMIHSGDCSQAAKALHLQSNAHVLKTAMAGTFEGGSLTQDDINVQTIKTGAYYLLATSALLTGTLLIPSEQERSKAHVITVSTLAALTGGLGAICLLAPNQ